MSRCCPPPAGITKPLGSLMAMSFRPARPRGRDAGGGRVSPVAIGRPWSSGARRLARGLRGLAHALAEAPAMTLEVERLVAALPPDVVARPVGDPCPRGDRPLVVRIEVGDVHADVLALDPAALRADGAVRALPSDPDHAIGELDDG